MFAKFDTMEQFDVWHAEVMQQLGIPNETGTTSYTLAWPSPTDNTVIAKINEQIDASSLVTLTHDEGIAQGYLPGLEIPGENGEI